VAAAHTWHCKLRDTVQLELVLCDTVRGSTGQQSMNVCVFGGGRGALAEGDWEEVVEGSGLAVGGWVMGV